MTAFAVMAALSMPAAADFTRPAPGDRFKTTSETIMCLAQADLDKINQIFGDDWAMQLAQFLARTPACTYAKPGHWVSVVAVPEDDFGVVKVMPSDLVTGSGAGVWVNIVDMSPGD